MASSVLHDQKFLSGHLVYPIALKRTFHLFLAAKQTMHISPYAEICVLYSQCIFGLGQFCEFLRKPHSAGEIVLEIR